MTGFFSATLRARSGKIAADGKAASLAVQRTNIASKGSASDSFSQYTNDEKQEKLQQCNGLFSWSFSHDNGFCAFGNIAIVIFFAEPSSGSMVFPIL